MIDHNYDFIIFQANPSKERILYYLDGSPEKRVITMEEFIKTMRFKQQDNIPGIYDAIRTYSFYLLSIPDKTCTRLEGSGNINDDQYDNNVTNVLHGKEPAKKEKKAQTLGDVLMGYGFNAPDERSVGNLKVLLSKQSQQDRGFLSRWFGGN